MKAGIPIGACIVLGALAGCGGSAPARADTVGAMTSEAVADRYDAAASLAVDVEAAVAAWCAGGDGIPVVEAIAAARAAWLELAPFGFGPGRDRRSRFIVDPAVSVDQIDKLLASDRAVDAQSLRDLAGADERGLGAVEHLAAGEPTERTCAYAGAAAELAAEELAALATEWGEYGPSLADDDRSANTALRNIVSESLFAVDMAGDEPDAPTSPHRLAGARWALLGDGEHAGISELLSATTVEHLRAEFEAADTMALEITIRTEVAGDLGITVNFSDADGDG